MFKISKKTTNLFRWLPDSPRWLLKRGEVKKVEQLLCNASNTFSSSVIMPNNLTYHLQVQSNNLVNEKPPARWFKLWRDSTMTTIRLLSVHVAFACFTIMYFGMVLNMPNYGRENLSSSARIIALSEIIGCCLGFYLAIKSNHKYLICGVFNFLGAVLAFSIWNWKEFGNDIHFKLFVFQK